MKLIYLTSQQYPSGKSDPFFWQKMAEAFQILLGPDFTFVVRNEAPHVLSHLNTVSVYAPWRFRSLSYFLRLPFLIFKHGWNNGEAFFFSADPYLLLGLIFWRRTLRLKYRVVSDWHQLFDDWKDIYIAEGSDFLVSTSGRLKGLLISQCGISPEKIIVAYGGVDTSLFKDKAKMAKRDYRLKLGLPDQGLLIGYIGTFKALGLDKGITTMIESLAFLDRDITMVFVGGTPALIAEYKLMAKNEGVAERAIFLLKQPYEKMVEYEMAMDILTIPYPNKPHFRDYGFPMKVWEYMAAGRPILYSNLDIIGEILRDRATSFVPGDPQSLAESVKIVRQGWGREEERAEQNIVAVEAYAWGSRADKIIKFLS